jgi:hypothetical protein
MTDFDTITATTTDATGTQAVCPAITLTTVAAENAEAMATEETLRLIDDLTKNSLITSGSVIQALELIEFERKNWEQNELAASHARLYSLLTKCYQFYLTMKSSKTAKSTRTQMASGLDSFIKARGFKTLADTHDMNRVVKAVFGEDRRRVSAYASALRVALTAGAYKAPIPAANLAIWIGTNGGVEEIRKAASKSGLSTRERIDTAQAVVQSKPLMSFKPDTTCLRFDSDDADKMMVLVVTYRPTGELEVNSVIKNASVLNAALSAYYADNKDDMANAVIAAKAAEQSAVAVVLNNI